MMPMIRHSEDSLEDAREHFRSLHGDYMETAKPTIIRLAWCLDEIDKLREALTRVMQELGVPQPGYPMPVANAYEVAQAALDGKAWEEEGLNA